MTMLSDTAFAPPSEAMDIVAALRRAGYTAYFCGGAVRDALLGVKPKDYDIASSATPAEVEKLFARTIPVGKAFGVMLVEGADGGSYEVATFRTDFGYADGRHPGAVGFSSPEEDAKRRDFTLNALFYDPFGNQVVDYVGGAADIERRLLRTVGEAERRFAEDRLRLLRAARFAARTGFRIEETTWRAMTAMAGDAIRVAPERQAAELEAMLTGGSSRAAFALLKDSGMLGHVLPEVDRLAGVEQPPDFHPEGDVWAHTLLMLDELDRASQDGAGTAIVRASADINEKTGMQRGDFGPEEYLAGIGECQAAFDDFWRLALAWSVLLHDIGKPDTFAVSDRIRFNDHDRLGAEMAAAALERLRRSNRLREAVMDLIRRHIHFSTLRRMRKSKLRRWLAAEAFPAHLELHRIDCAASHRMFANWFFGLSSWREEKALPPRAEPFVRGGDLLALGMVPGPEVGKLLSAIEDARLEGTVATREEALAFARKNILSI